MSTRYIAKLVICGQLHMYILMTAALITTRPITYPATAELHSIKLMYMHTILSTLFFSHFTANIANFLDDLSSYYFAKATQRYIAT